MLEKTIKLLERVAPGTYLDSSVECFDPTEIDKLGHLLNQLIYSPSSLRKALQQRGVTITRADFYSEIPTIEHLENSFKTKSKLALDKVFSDPIFMIDYLSELDVFAEEFDPPINQTASEFTFSWEGGPFSYSDAMAYYTTIRRQKPKTIIEIGGGFSTLIAKAACERNGDGNVIAIEPYPAPFLTRLDGIELIAEKVQGLDVSFFNDRLNDGDVLFIDSTHTVKHDSDVLHIYLRILPEITKNIYVHVHDIFLPNTLSFQTMIEHQIFWNEQYLLYAYMLDNPRTKTLYGSAYHHIHNPGLLESFMRGRYGAGGGSFWFSQAARSASAGGEGAR